MTNNLEFICATTQRLLNGCIAVSEEGINLFRPDGRGRYPAVWTRDFAYMVEYASELMNLKDVYFNLKYIMDHAAPEGYIPDRVTPSGYVSYRIDRDECPRSANLDNGPFLIIAADAYLKRLDEAEAKALFEEWRTVLCRGIDWIPRTEDGIVYVADDDLHVGYGFTDTIKKTGALSKESLLLWKAAGLLSGWLKKCGLDSEKYDSMVAKIEANLCRTLSDESGMLFSATKKCHQLDVWASCYMISIGFPVSSEQRANIARWLVTHYDDVVQHGQIRHLPGGEYWESVYIPFEPDTYQNGAHWAVATGWFYDALKDHDAALAEKTVQDVLDYFRTYGVYECIHGEYQKLESYVVSATNVYDAVKKITRAHQEG